jgi:two-component system, LytTR family, response regulator
VRDVLRVVVAEDQDVLRFQIIDLISKLDGFEIIYSTNNGIQLFNILKKHKPDVVITDIDMPGMTGIEAIQCLRKELPDIEIIFISAFNKFIRQAVNLYAIDFIEKPLSTSRLIETLDRIKIRNLVNVKLVEFKSDNSIHLIKATDLFFVEAYKKKTKVFSDKGEIESTFSLKKVEELLNEDFFYRTSRSHIVNMKKVRGIKPISRASFEIHFERGNWIAYLSKNRYEEFRSSLKKYF